MDVLEEYGSIIDECLAGRIEEHKCPICKDGELDCRVTDEKVTLKCKKCGRFFEGLLA